MEVLEKVYEDVLQLPSLPDEGHAFLNACGQLFLCLLQSSSVHNIKSKAAIWNSILILVLMELREMNKVLFCAGKVCYLSYSLRGPRGKISSAPFRPSRTLLAKKGSSVTWKFMPSGNHKKPLNQWYLLGSSKKMMKREITRWHVAHQKRGKIIEVWGYLMFSETVGDG